MITFIIDLIIVVALFKFFLNFSKKKKEKRESELKTFNQNEIEEKINKIKRYKYEFIKDDKLFELIRYKLAYELFLKKDIDLYNFKETNIVKENELENYLYNKYFITLKEFDMLTHNFKEDLNFFSSTHKILIEREKMEEAKFYIKENFSSYIIDYKAILLKQRELLFETIERKRTLFPNDEELLELKEEYVIPEEILIEYIDRKEKIKSVIPEKKNVELKEKMESLEENESYLELQREENKKIILEEEKKNQEIFSENLRIKYISLDFNDKIIKIKEQSYLESQKRRKEENDIWKEKIRLEEEKIIEEQKRLEEERRLAEQRRIAEEKRREEERRLAEQRRLEEARKLEDCYKETTEGFSIYNENIFGYGIKHGLPYFYFTKYYPVNKYGYDYNQEFVFEFKDGDDPLYYANIFSRLIEKIFENNREINIEDVTIIPVAASTIHKNEKRYKRLFELISERTGVINGYNIVEVINDREAKHLTNEYNSVDSHIKIHFEKLKSPRRIILIDDVITRGRTIKELANKFIDREKGSFVVGMVLAETYSDWIGNNNFYDDKDKPRIGMNKMDILDFEEIVISSLEIF